MANKSFLVAWLFLITACMTAQKDTVKDAIPYSLSTPDGSFSLDKKLSEISGLCLWKNRELAAVNDEKGEVFILNAKDGSIKRTLKFGEKGDYEGIECVDEDIFVLRSDGKIFRIKDAEKKKQEIKSYKTPFTSKNDLEGLAFSKSENALLILAKEKPNISKKKKYNGKKAAYWFDLDKKELKERPAFTIDLNDLSSFRLSKFGGSLSELKFKPSAVAIHPISKMFYVLSSTSAELLVLNTNHSIFDLVKLHKGVSQQPESITFDNQNRLYIASEGDTFSAVLQYYDQVK